MGNNESVSGSWTSDCLSENVPTDLPSGTRYARSYSLTLTERLDVVITLESATDPYLFLLDGEGDVLSENDDINSGGAHYNSRIEVTLDSGDYTVEATTYATEATGEFTLTVDGLPAAEEEYGPAVTSQPARCSDSDTTTARFDPPSKDLSGCYLAKADLAGSGVSWRSANFSSANLTNANLSGYNFTNTNFSEATLTGAVLDGSSFPQTNFSGATLTNADLSGSGFTDTNFSGADLTDADLSGGGYEWSKLNFTNANLIRARLGATADISNAVWSNTICPDGTNSDDSANTMCYPDHTGLTTNEGPHATLNPDVPPPTPDGFRVRVSDTHNNITFLWSPSRIGIASYRIEYLARGGEAWATLTEDGRSGTTGWDSLRGLPVGLACESSYEFRLFAYGDGITWKAAWGQPTASSGQMYMPDCPAAAGAPDKPRGFTSTAGYESATIRWNDPQDDSITKYQYRLDDSERGAWQDIPGSGADTTSTKST